jgi:hypothetical protein
MLEIPFLWIDALCIVQDSPEELAYEISIMDSVYQNALLSIAAKGSPSAGHGLFVHRDPRLTSPCELFIREESREGTYNDDEGA